MSTKHAVIIGGGISGLAAANRLCELKAKSDIDVNITLLEAEEFLGGLLHTYRPEGYVMEAGAESFITDKPWALDLCKRLNLENELIGTNPQERFSYVLLNKKRRKIPADFYLIAPGNLWSFMSSDILSFAGKLRVLSELFLPAKRFEEETVGAFIRRRFGRECLKKIGQPMIGGIYGGDVEKLSLKATFPKFIQMEKEYGSVIKALMLQRKSKAKRDDASGPRYNLFVTFKHGLQTLAEALANRIATDVEIQKKTKVTGLEKTGAKWLVHRDKGNPIEADVVCLSLPLQEQANLLQSSAPEISSIMNSISKTSAITVNLAYKINSFAQEPHGFGFVVPETEDSCLVGCTFSTRKFEHRSDRDHFLLRAFVRHDRAEQTDEAIIQETHLELAELLGIKDVPVLSKLTRYSNRMPQYHTGHDEKIIEIERLKTSMRGLFFAGNFYSGVGIPDCIRRAEEEAQKIFENLLS